MATGVTLLSLSHSTQFLFGAFFLIGPLHFLTTIELLKSAKFEVLNQSKLTLISDHYINSIYNAVTPVLSQTPKTPSGSAIPVLGQVPTLQQLESRERWFGEWIAPGVDVPKIRLGGTLAKTFSHDPQQLAVSLSVLQVSVSLILIFFFFKTTCNSFFFLLE